MSSDTNKRGANGAAAGPAELEAAIARRREHLAATVDELVVRAQPKEIARRGAQDAKASLISATHTPEGELRNERLAAVVGAVLALVAVLVVLRRRRARTSL
jgi:hypothetical protein